MDSNIIFNQLKEYWFNKQCDDNFQNILNDSSLGVYEKESKCLDYLRDIFSNFKRK